MTKAEFIHLLTAEGYLPHEIEGLWESMPASLDADTLDPKGIVGAAKEMLPRFRSARDSAYSAWDDI